MVVGFRALVVVAALFYALAYVAGRKYLTPAAALSSQV